MTPGFGPAQPFVHSLSWAALLGIKDEEASTCLSRRGFKSSHEAGGQTSAPGRRMDEQLRHLGPVPSVWERRKSQLSGACEHAIDARDQDHRPSCRHLGLDPLPECARLV